MGIPGMVLAPVLLCYVKGEALEIEVTATGDRPPRSPGKGGRELLPRRRLP
ncbi:MAG TPA: hypothetical protein VGV61_08535 [Thermoanaerobaculia bacterium]|jgi:hypothetical protein|nr:hypothetical protein [Thermoanaerobaculia bacterium]